MDVSNLRQRIPVWHRVVDDDDRRGEEEEERRLAKEGLSHARAERTQDALIRRGSHSSALLGPLVVAGRRQSPAGWWKSRT